MISITEHIYTNTRSVIIYLKHEKQVWSILPVCLYYMSVFYHLVGIAE